jgi:hypothetical protein
MPRILPARPNIEYLKHQAKDLLNAYRAGDLAAQQLFAQHLPAALLSSPTDQEPQQLKRTHALLVLAREYGFTSWPKLVQHIKTAPAELRVPNSKDDRRAEKQARKLANQQRIAEVAEKLVVAARNQELRQLFATLSIGRGDGDDVRAYLVAHDMYTTVIDALLIAAEHPHDRLRFLAAQAMDHFADQRCAEPLRRMLHDAVPRVRWAAIHSLQCEECKLAPLTFEHDVIATLIKLALEDPSIKVRRVATGGLGQVCTDPRAIAALTTIRAQATDRTVLRNARYALEQHAQG